MTLILVIAPWVNTHVKTRLYASDTGSSMYVNYTSITWFKKKTEKNTHLLGNLKVTENMIKKIS